MSIKLFSVILWERASIFFSLSSTSIAKEEGILPYGAFLVLQAHWQRLRVNGSFFLAFFSETFAICFRGNFLFIYLEVQSHLRCFPASIVARETASYLNEPKRICTLRLWIVFIFFVFLSFLPSWARKLLILPFISLNVQFFPNFSTISL